MEKITRNNYEAFFLDYLEGGLDEEAVGELKEFLAANSDLAVELDGFESLTIEPKPSGNDWNSLKAPEEEKLQNDQGLRDRLYFRCAEGEPNAHDQRMLERLLSKQKFAREYESWKRLRLNPQEELVAEKGGFYRLPLQLPVTPSNYEDFLIARTEGLLSEKENEALKKYAAALPSGERDLALADSLKLEAPKGIFYPNKNGLKKKRGGFLVFYRAASILLLVGLGAAVFAYLNRDEPASPRYSQRSEVEAPSDTLGEGNPVEKAREDTIPQREKVERYPLEEWEIMEPEPVFVAEDNQAEERERIELPQIDMAPDEIEFAEEVPIEIPQMEEITLPDPEMEPRGEDEILLADNSPFSSRDVEYKTLTEIAEEKVAEEFDLTDAERDELALSLARHITQKAGEALDSEVKKEVDEDKDRLTYSLRIRGFKVSHSRAK